jgi:hypothetical protein
MGKGIEYGRINGCWRRSKLTAAFAAISALGCIVEIAAKAFHFPGLPGNSLGLSLIIASPMEGVNNKTIRNDRRSGYIESGKNVLLDNAILDKIQHVSLTSITVHRYHRALMSSLDSDLKKGINNLAEKSTCLSVCQQSSL